MKSVFTPGIGYTLTAQAKTAPPHIPTAYASQSIVNYPKATPRPSPPVSGSIGACLLMAGMFCCLVPVAPLIAPLLVCLAALLLLVGFVLCVRIFPIVALFLGVPAGFLFLDSLLGHPFLLGFVEGMLGGG